MVRAIVARFQRRNQTCENRVFGRDAVISSNQDLTLDPAGFASAGVELGVTAGVIGAG
jgi:hypothetical protein